MRCRSHRRLVDLAAEAGSCPVAESSGELNVTNAVAKHSAERPYVKSPLTIREIMAGGEPIPDPGGVAGGLRWDVPGAYNGSVGTWELVVDPQTNTVLHFIFKAVK